MPPPDRITIGAHVYHVQRVPARLLMNDAGEPLNGDCDPDALVIRLAARMRKSKTQEITLHEVLHACIYPSGVDDESVVTALAPSLLQVMKSNPALVAYLLKDAP